MVFIAVSPTGLLTSWPPHISCRVGRSPVRPIVQAACHALFHRPLRAIRRGRADPHRRECHFLFQECIAITTRCGRRSLSAAKQCRAAAVRAGCGPVAATYLNGCFKLEKRAGAHAGQCPSFRVRTACRDARRRTRNARTNAGRMVRVKRATATHAGNRYVDGTCVLRRQQRHRFIRESCCERILRSATPINGGKRRETAGNKNAGLESTRCHHFRVAV